MREQEEEMRQNMEELQVAQEEMQRKMKESVRIQNELDARMEVLNRTAFLTETDLHGTITFVNDKFCQVSKWGREEALRNAHNIVRHPDNPKELFKERWDTIKAGNIFQGRLANRTKEGSHYWVDAVISPVLDESGKPVKYIGVHYIIPDDTIAKMMFNKMKEELSVHI